MANNDDNKSSPSLRSINKGLDALDTSMDNLYQKTYSTRTDNKNDLDRINTDINNSIDDLLSKVNGQDISDISTLYSRLQRKGATGDDVAKELESLVTDNSVVDSINMENVEKYIQSEDYQYDLICKYMPKLEDAIEIKKDNVLSADSFTKEFINASINKSSDDILQVFSSRARNLKKKYKVENLFEEMYYETAKYGEYFLYHVPYKTAFERLLKRKNAPVKMESAATESDISSKVIFESSKMDTDLSKALSKEFIKEDLSSNSKVILHLDPYGMIPEAVEEIQEANKAMSKVNSLTENYLKEDSGYKYQNNFSMGTSQNMSLKYDELAPSDGLVGGTGTNPKVKEMAGSVLQKIPRENVIPCYIGDYCIGYYYFSIVNEFTDEQVVTGGQYNSITNTSRIEVTELDRQNDMLVGHIAASLATAIDDKFINSNTDLKNEIYAILRYNDKFNAALGVNTVTVCFLPASDVTHFYFKLDKVTHRGISDLKKAVVPAMLYCLLYLTDIINKVSRSQDKRVYYVKQNVDTNVARTMLNVITQIKKGNMGMRQLENMNTIFNVIGKYNDFIIPQNQSGEAPIQMEVMQGQQTDSPTDLMNLLEDMAVSSTDVPLEFVQSVNQVDYATRFTMSNSKFLRKVFKRQSVCQDDFSLIFQKLYNYEYMENEQSIEILLPAPAFLTLTNSQQLIDNTKNFANSLADIELGDQDDLKPKFVKLYLRNNLGTYINYDLVDKLIDKAKQDTNMDASKNLIPEEETPEEDTGNNDEF